MALVHPRMRSVPLRVPHSLSAVRPVGRTSSLGFVPLNDVARASPVWSGPSRPLRFRSRVFSTPQRFPSNPEFRGLVSCRCRSRASPFRGFPSIEVAHPSRGHSAPLRSSTSVLCRRHAALITAGFRDVRAFTRLPPSPDDYGIPFHAPERTLPDHPGTSRRNSTRSARFIRFEALILQPSPFAPTRVAPSPRPILSWSSSPP